jgi:hypothetical protein
MGSEFTVELWVYTFTTMINVKALAAFLTEPCFMFLTNSDGLPVRMISAFHFIIPHICSLFAPLESPSGVAQKYRYISKMIFRRFNGHTIGYKRTKINVQHH